MSWHIHKFHKHRTMLLLLSWWLQHLLVKKKVFLECTLFWIIKLLFVCLFSENFSPLYTTIMDINLMMLMMMIIFNHIIIIIIIIINVYVWQTNKKKFNFKLNKHSHTHTEQFISCPSSRMIQIYLIRILKKTKKLEVWKAKEIPDLPDFFGPFWYRNKQKVSHILLLFFFFFGLLLLLFWFWLKKKHWCASLWGRERNKMATFITILLLLLFIKFNDENYHHHMMMWWHMSHTQNWIDMDMLMQNRTNKTKLKQKIDRIVIHMMMIFTLCNFFDAKWIFCCLFVLWIRRNP